MADNANPRETLYLNIKDINEELTRKRKELHLSTLEPREADASGEESRGEGDGISLAEERRDQDER